MLLDADRVHLRVVARIARSAGRYRGRPGLEDWVDGHVLAVLGDVIREDHESARGSATSGEEVPDAFLALAGPLGLDPSSMRKACACLQLLPLADRAAFVDPRAAQPIPGRPGAGARRERDADREARDARSTRSSESVRPLGGKKGSV